MMEYSHIAQKKKHIYKAGKGDTGACNTLLMAKDRFFKILSFLIPQLCFTFTSNASFQSLNKITLSCILPWSIIWLLISFN